MACYSAKDAVGLLAPVLVVPVLSTTTLAVPQQRPAMQGLIALLLLGGIEVALGHGGAHTGPEAGETIQQYAQRHVRGFST